jgi:hypothetical protein
MSSHAMLVKGMCLSTVLLIVISCLKTGAEAPPPEQNPFDLIKKLSAGIEAATPIESARSRCLAKQHARLEGCAGKHGQERAICEAVAHELIAVCEQMNPDAPAYLASGLFCSGSCAITPCNPTCIIPGTTNRSCLGNICTTEGLICDPGTFFDCNCVTGVIGPPLTQSNFCSCSCT